MGTEQTYVFDYNSSPLRFGLDAVINEASPNTASTTPLVLKKSSGSDEKRIIMRPDTGYPVPSAVDLHRAVNSVTLNLNVTANSSTVDAPVIVQAIKQDTTDYPVDTAPYITWNQYDDFQNLDWSTAGAKDTTDDLYDSGKDYGLGRVQNRLNTIETTMTSGVVSLSLNPKLWEQYFIAEHENYGFVISTDAEGVNITFDGSTGGGTAPTMVVDYSPPLNTSGSGDDIFAVSYEGQYSVSFDTRISGEGTGAETRYSRFTNPVRKYALKAIRHRKTTDPVGPAEFLYDFFVARKGRAEAFYVYDCFNAEWVRVRFDTDTLTIDQIDYALFNADIPLIEVPLL